MLMPSGLERKPAPLAPSSLAAGKDNGISNPATAHRGIRNHSHSRSSSATTAAFAVSNASNPNGTHATVRAPQSVFASTTVARPQTAPHRPDRERVADRGREDYPAKFAAAAQGPSPGTKRTSSVAEGGFDTWSASPTSPAGEERGHKRRSSFARRLSFGTNGGLFNNGSGATSPTRRKITKDTRRRSPDSSPQKRRSFHSPPPPGRSSRVTSQLPPISTLPSLPKLSFEPLLSSAGAISPPAGLTSPISLESSTGDFFSAPAKSSKPTKSPKRRRDTSGKARADRAEEDAPVAVESYQPSTLSISAFRPANQADHRGAPVLTRERSETEASPEHNNGGGSATPSRRRDKRERDKKAMLSRALQKANTAVLLDNAQNFEGAVDAYSEACRLLQQVMETSSTDEDRNKLDAIHTTYTNRMQELFVLNPALYQGERGRELPARPDSEGEMLQLSHEPPMSDDEEQPVLQTATIVRAPEDQTPRAGPQKSQLAVPSARDSTLSSAIKAVQSSLTVDNDTSFYLHSPAEPPGQGMKLELPMDKSYMPPPLSPRPPPSPTAPELRRAQAQDNHLQAAQKKKGHSRDDSRESMSWLDTIDESGSSSCRSSVHERSPNGALRRKTLTVGAGRPESHGSAEADFDAALDAAVEAAYDEGMELVDRDGQVLSPEDHVQASLRNVEVAKERVRQAEREEAIHAAKAKERERLLKTGTMSIPASRNQVDLDPYGDDDDAEEEERMLDEMTREYMLDGFDFGLQSKSALPRQSDGSEIGSTWNSSRSSNRTTGTTAATALSSLGTVAEGDLSEIPPPTLTSKSLAALPTVTETSSGKATSSAHRPSVSRPSTAGAATSLPAMPPPTGALPQLPPQQQQQQQQTSVRSRRLSGQNAKQLKIETISLNKQTLQKKQPDLPPLSGSASGTPPIAPSRSPAPQTGLTAGVYQPSSDGNSNITMPVLDRRAPAFASSPADTMVTISPATPALSKAVSNDTGLVPASPGLLGKGGRVELRKNKSSLSLKASRQLSISSPDVSDGGSVATPMSTTFSNYSARTKSSTLINHSALSERSVTNLSNTTLAAPAAPLPGLTTFETGPMAGGMQLFDTDMHSSSQPGSPNPLAYAPPAPLEPCPCSHLLRPFWLMRCLYQTLAHPRGGYISTKLFVPRDIWKTKGLKLKSVEDKIANCDLLSAALGKLARVDMIDADAVLEEMQSLEIVLDQVQANLQKKLGSEVGASGAAQFFKDAPTMSGESGIAGVDTSGTRTSGGDKSRSYLSSWRKLRSKNSAAGLTSLSTGGAGSMIAKREAGGGEDAKNAPTMATVPMTSLPNIRFTKRDPEKAEFGPGFGPLANYMASLATLCDAVQIIDTIARQVEDPGLKAASQTHVGLELCTRHASEFFGFYICRFILADVGIMLDKFLKRSSEWVLV